MVFLVGSVLSHGRGYTSSKLVDEEQPLPVLVDICGKLSPNSVCYSSNILGGINMQSVCGY